MNTFLTSRQRGFAIADALIAFGVMVFAGVALLSLQGDLMNGSRSSKAQAEAIMIARDHMEMWRNYVEEAQFVAGPSPSKPMVDIPGVNATYTVSYFSTPDPLSADDENNLEVKVSWPGFEVDADGVPVEENVSLETMIYYTKPEIASAINSLNNGDASKFRLPSPFITGVEGEDPNPPPSTGDDGGTPDVLLDGAGKPHTTLTIKTYYNVVDSVTSYSNVEVIDSDGNVKLTSFGGIVHKLQGEIIVDSGADTTLGLLAEDLKILASPPSYCVFPICDGGDCTDKDRAKYVCYVPGDCTYQDVYSSGNLYDCPTGFVPPADDDFEDLNGGWYGRVGNFGVAIHPDDKVCTFETDIDAPKTNLTPSRNYVKYRCGVDLVGEKCPTDSIIANEGVNRPYSNQDFLIISKNQSCPSGLVTSRIEGTPLVGIKTFNTDGTPTDTWEKNIVLSPVTCDTDPSVTDPSVTDGSCLHLP